ncbi:hypothetical protein X975_01833, partial [Stegodyphus mimosarum]
MFFSFQMENAIILKEKARRRNRKYQGEEITFQARVDMNRLPQNTRNRPLLAVTESVRQLFEILIQRSTENLRPTDW